MADYIQVGILAVAVITFLISSYISRRLEKRKVYQQLEFASIELFRFEIAHSDVLRLKI
jgi:hypothetical protein